MSTCAEARDGLHHVFLSPHLDDAVLSCGGTIAKLTWTGEHVTILTLFAGPAAPPYSDLARQFHSRWGEPADVVRLRRAEDAAAAARLGADARHEDVPDALYRLDGDGAWLYPRAEDLAGAPHADDAWIVRHLRERVRSITYRSPCRVYGPVAIGRHVDHVLAFGVTSTLETDDLEVSYYEDFPYVTRESHYLERTVELGGWRSAVVEYDEGIVAAKIDALAYYRSQLSMLFRRPENLGPEVRRWNEGVVARDGAFGERFWHPPAHS